MPKSNDTTPKLRGKPLDVPLHVVLVEPEIPPNTGNIARLCAATGSVLHLVGRLGFRIDDAAVRRAGLDYWPLVKLEQHVDFAQFVHAYQQRVPEGRFFLLSGMSPRNYLNAAFRPGDAIVFGKESVGLDDTLLERYADRTLAVPMLGGVRSLNLANAAGIVLYEALRQCGALDTATLA